MISDSDIDGGADGPQEITQEMIERQINEAMERAGNPNIDISAKNLTLNGVRYTIVRTGPNRKERRARKSKRRRGGK